jgi:2-keto-3-deoxy-L-rhamnonate aldolase RhmA
MHGVLREKLDRGDVALGTWVTVNSPDLVEIASDAGFDFLIFDAEHAPLTMESIQSLLQVLKSDKTTTPIVRVAWNDQVMIKLALDIGASGLLIPQVKNADDVVSASRAMKYPPEGIRGLGPRRASNYYREMQDYASRANTELVSILQIEHIDAVKNLGTIVSTALKEKISSLFVGPADLSASMGLLGKYDDKSFTDALQKILDESKKANIALGIHAFDVEDAVRRIKQGFRVITVSSDVSMIGNVFHETLSDVRKYARG